MSVIEADTVNTQPLAVDSIQIYAAQRYSVVITADQPIDNYWIRANPSTGNRGYQGGINSAILRYEGAPEVDPTTTKTGGKNPMNEADLIPYYNPGAPGIPERGKADVNLLLDIDTVELMDGKHFTINKHPFIPPSLPVLLQILSGAKTAQQLLPPGSVYTVPKNSVIEVAIPDKFAVSCSSLSCVIA